MSCILTTTVRIHRAVGTANPAAAPAASSGGTATTAILDWLSPAVLTLASECAGAEDRAVLQAAHALIRERVRPVYSLAERRPASRTLALGRGSCSQRLALLEAVARARGIATRTRGLLVHGGFWRPRFGALAPLLPERILLAWPQFRIDGTWVDASDLFDPASDARPFTNLGAETLFDAIGRGAARWTPHVADCACDAGPLPEPPRDLGLFASRDELFRRYGQNLPCLIRALVEPVFGRWAAGAAVPRF